MAKYIKTRWEVRTYDVWGNEKDGYEVNNSFIVSREYPMLLRIEKANEGTAQEFEYAGPTDRQLREALNCKPRIKLETDGDDLTIYVNHAATGYPLGELHCVSHESLSPIRKKEEKPISKFDPTTAPDTVFGRFAARYCEKQEQTLDGLRAILREQREKFNPDGWVLLECQQMDSSFRGQLTVLPYGPNNTFKTIPDKPVSPRGLVSDMSTVVATLAVNELE